MTPEQKAALEAENARLKAEIAAANAQQAARTAAAKHAEHASYAESLVSAGRLAPKDQMTVVAVLDFTDGESSIEFGEGDAKQPLASAFKAFLQALPAVVDFGEAATKNRVQGQTRNADFGEADTDPDRLALHRRAMALSEEKNISYEQAVQRLL